MISNNNNINIEKNTDPHILKLKNKDVSYKYDFSKIRKIAGMEKVNEKIMYA